MAKNKTVWEQNRMLNKPIIVHKDGRTVLDGNHRVAKARKTGTTSLPAYIPETKMDLKFLIRS